MVSVPWSIGRDSLLLRKGPRRGRRSLYACGLLIAAYWLAARGLPNVASIWWLAPAPAVLIVALLARGWACRIGLCVALVLLSAGWYAARVHERPRESIAWAVDEETEDGQIVLAGVRGVVTESPRPVAPPGGVLGAFSRSEPAIGFTLAVSGIETEAGHALEPASGELRVRIGGPRELIPAWLRAGETVSLTGRIRGVGPPSNPGEPDWQALAVQEGRIGSVDLRDGTLAVRAEAQGWRERAASWWYGSIGVLHARCEAAIDGGGGAPAGDPEKKRARALLGALLLGERDAALDEVNAAFTRLGLLHLVAISGFNLAVMAGLALFGLRLTGDRGWVESAGVAALVALYMLVLPAQAPIVRAGILVLLLLLADASGRRYDRATLLGWIAIALLVLRPLDAWSLGFQLSFGIVGALLLLGDTVHARLWGVPLRGLAPTHAPHGRSGWRSRLATLANWGGRWVVRTMKAQISASLLAWGVSIPIIACQTGQLSLLTPVMTLIVLPLTVVVLWGGYIALLLGVMIPSAAGWTGAVLDWMAEFLVNVVMRLDRVPGSSMHLPKLSAWWALAAVAGVVYLLLHGSRRNRWSWVIVAGLAGWFGVEFWAHTRLPAGVSLRIDTLAVGDGSCHLIRSGSDATLWDCGSLNTGLGERTIPQAVRELGAWHVPTIVVTHAHIDHFSAIPDVVEPLGVKRIIVPPQLLRAASFDPKSAPGMFVAEMRRRGVRIETVSLGDRVDLAGHEARVLWPPAEREFHNANDSSIVATLEVPCGNRKARVLLTGDASAEALANLLPAAADSPEGMKLRADVLELPHHGSYIPPAVELVRLSDPRIVVQSTGQRRAGDQRWDGPMAGRAWYKTPRSGAAWVEIRDDGTIGSGSLR
jgi:competence protein ComEC